MELGKLGGNSLVDGRRAEKSSNPSVLVACIGDAFMEGVKEAAIESLEEYGRMSSASLELFVLPSLTVMPPLGLGCMRNFMVRRAALLGYDYLMLLDNDIMLTKDTISQLVTAGKDYITPWHDQTPYKGSNPFEPLTEPMYQRGQGIRLLQWTVPYCALIRTSVFARTGYAPFTGSMIYHEDCYNSAHFRCNGIDIWQDTDCIVQLLRGSRMLWEHLGDGKIKICKPFEQP